MMVTISIPDEHIRGAILSAFDGGIAYWCSKRELAHTYSGEHGQNVLKGTYALYERDTKMETLYRLSETNLTRGLQTMARLVPYHFANLIQPLKWDQETGDVLIQCTVFGEIKYG